MISKYLPVLAKLSLRERLQVQTRISGQNVREREARAPSNPEGFPSTLKKWEVPYFKHLGKGISWFLPCRQFHFIKMLEDVLRQETESEML